MVRVDEAIPEARGITTLRFTYRPSCSPGQFLMVWIPGVDEIPMSLSYVGERKGITVKTVGEASLRMSSLREGDHIGVRGPFGRGFVIGDRRTLCVGGGVGAATLMPAAEAIADTQLVEMAIGALSSSEVIFEKRASSLGRVHISTDDGSAGFHGTVVDMVTPMIKDGNYEMVLACGPEKMLLSLLFICREMGVKCQFALERYMKCGVGLCGSCAIDGMRVCVEGPVFFGEELSDLPEFGRVRRDACGRRIDL